MKKNIKIGVRSSKLALAMAKQAKDILAAYLGGSFQLEIVAMSTQGDRVLNRSLAEIGGKGLFTEEIESALLLGEIDLAVHSTKDMPTILPPGLRIAAYLPRGAREDCFISNGGQSLLDIPKGSVIGTSSLRRTSLLRKIRPDLKVGLLRGNVETRLSKVAKGEFDGTFLAYCGLQRIGLQGVETEKLALDFFAPAPAQGCICLEAASSNSEILAILAQVNDMPTNIEAVAERSFLERLEGSCRTPICAYSIYDEQNSILLFYGEILDKNTAESFCYKKQIAIGSDKIGLDKSDKIKQASRVGIEAADYLRRQVGEVFFAQWK